MFNAFLLTLLTFVSYAHQSSLTNGGNELFWANTSIPLTIRTNTSDLSSAAARSIIQDSIDQWNPYSRAKLSVVGSSQNEIRFLSDFPYGSGVIGVTEVSYNSSGAISRAVVSLNDDYYFYSGEGTYVGNSVFLGDVVTHELGHLLGLSHSEVLNSTMFYANFSGQSTLASDDIAGVRTKYSSGFGKITGQIKGGNNIGVLGVHVQAISRSTGESTATVSLEDGHFRLDGLNLNDTYYIYTSPLKNVGSLPSYFANTQNLFCPSTYVGSFFSRCGRSFNGRPEPVNLLESNPSVVIGTVSINCKLRSDDAYNLRKLQTSFAPLTIWDYLDEPKHEKSFVGWFYPSSTTNWSTADELDVDLTGYNDLGGTQKYLKVSLISQSLGTQLEYEMSLKHNNVDIGADRSLVGPLSDGTYKTDLEAMVPLSYNNEANNFQISVRAKKLSGIILDRSFPVISNFTSEQYLPYLLVASVWELTPEGFKPTVDDEPVLSDNESCLDAPYTYAVAKAQSAKEQTDRNKDQIGAMAGCGTIDPPKSGPTSSLPLMAFGFFTALLLSSFIKSRKNFLS